MKEMMIPRNLPLVSGILVQHCYPCSVKCLLSCIEARSNCSMSCLCKLLNFRPICMWFSDCSVISKASSITYYNIMCHKQFLGIHLKGLCRICQKCSLNDVRSVTINGLTLTNTLYHSNAAENPPHHSFLPLVLELVSWRWRVDSWTPWSSVFSEWVQRLRHPASPELASGTASLSSCKRICNEGDDGGVATSKIDSLTRNQQKFKRWDRMLS